MLLNFVKTRSKNYTGVQQEILGLIQTELSAESWLESTGFRRDGCLNVSLFIHQPTDVVLSHGLADKNYFFRKDRDESRDRIARRLLHVLVPGLWLRNRLLASKKLGLSPEQVHVVGWPRLDPLFEKQRLLEVEPSNQRRKRVLWAPTHDYQRRGTEMVSMSSYPEFEPYIQLLQEDFDVQVALHPRNRQDKVPTAEKLIWADYVISDFGTLVYEAWALGKPVIFPGWIIRERILEFLARGCAESVIFRQGIGLHATSFEQLCEFLRNESRIDTKVDEFMDSYLAREYRGSSSRRVAEVLLQLAGA